MRNWSQSSTSGYGARVRGGMASAHSAMLYRRHACASFPTSPYFSCSQPRKRSAVAGQKQYDGYAGYVEQQLKFRNAQVELLRAVGSQRSQEESR